MHSECFRYLFGLCNSIKSRAPPSLTNNPTIINYTRKPRENNKEKARPQTLFKLAGSHNQGKFFFVLVYLVNRKKRHSSSHCHPDSRTLKKKRREDRRAKVATERPIRGTAREGRERRQGSSGYPKLRILS